MKVAVAMSGGIDSSVAAFLLVKEGHDVSGITARFIPHNEINNKIFDSTLKDAISVASALNIKHHVFDFSEAFESTVINQFCIEYQKGMTPNPCINCNRNIKFGLLLDEAEKLGYDYIATGHYVLKKQANGRFYVAMSPDINRDQSYFLCLLGQEQLGRAIFPLGSMTKTEVRSIARKNNLITHNKPDSQEICFIPGNDYIQFLENKKDFIPAPGNIVDNSGKTIGRHNGIHRYTVGQRRGLGISSPNPLYVTGIDSKNNTITAGTKNELYVTGLETSDVHEMKYIVSSEIHANIKTRSTQNPFRGTVKKDGNRFIVMFDEPQIGISPGQTAVFYGDDMGIIGCGTIAKSIRQDQSFSPPPPA